MGGVILAQPIGTGYKLPTKELIAVNNTIKSTKQIVLAHDAVQGSEIILLNGVELVNDVSMDYVFTDDKTIQFHSDWVFEIGDNFLVKYFKK